MNINNYIFNACVIKIILAYDSISVALVGGPNPWEGRVEITVNNSTGTVCDDAWDNKDADVVCRMLGYEGALSAPGGAAYGEGEGDIFLDDVDCAGDESHIMDCFHAGLNIDNCVHSEDASVVCRRGIILYYVYSCYPI